MSSMTSTLRFKAVSAAVLSTLALAGSASAQIGGGNEPPDGSTMVAQVPSEMQAAISKWELLQKNTQLGFYDYSGFALAYPTFPRMEIIRLRAESTLAVEAPSRADVLRFFDANPPLSNPALARYAMALAAESRIEAFETARAAWRGGDMADNVELTIESLYARRFTPEDHAARMDALLWQGKAEAAARQLIPANLELGGKDPMIITANADPQWAAGVALRASVVATGQACQSIERVFVAQEIAEPFLAALVEGAKAVEITHPDPASGHIGPFIFPSQAGKVQAQIDDAVPKGAEVLAGGQVENLDGGQYLRPTVLANVTPDMAVMREETFGPVIPVTIFEDLDAAIEQANDTEYGLSAAVLAGSLEEAASIGTRLDAGAISLQDGALTSMVGDAPNQSRKASGLGPSRMGDTGMLRFLREQAMIRQTGQPLPIQAYAEGQGG